MWQISVCSMTQLCHAKRTRKLQKILWLHYFNYPSTCHSKPLFNCHTFNFNCCGFILFVWGLYCFHDFSFRKLLGAAANNKIPGA